LNNAIKYTEKGSIYLEVDREIIDAFKIRLRLRVTDTGIGINESDIEKLFADFTRLDLERNQGIEGTGLGLAIASTFCRAMGGEISVSSTYGKGSVFVATLIQTFEDPKRSAEVSYPDQKKILLYENRPAYASSIMNAMSDLGLNPVCPPDLPAFLSELEHGSYDFAFVSSIYAVQSIPVWGKRKTPLELVVMVELGEVSVYRDTGSIQMPVYANTLANVINGVSSGNGVCSLDSVIHFAAPKAKILLVDDLATNLKVASELMAPYKMKIETCMSGPAAIDLVSASAAPGEAYDLVLMDHMMPIMDGLEAVEKIRNIDKDNPYFQNLPVIMFTANAVAGQREMFLQNGVDDFLAKPIEMQKLNAILEKWIPKEKQTETTELVSNGNGVKKKLPSIPGINTKEGLKNTGGIPQAYINILSVFYRDANDRAGEIRESADAGDISRYTTLVHALKSASRSIGAADLGNAAEQLEDAGKHRNMLMIADKTGDFLEQLQALTGNIYAALNQYGSDADKTGTIELQISELESLKEALINMNIEAVDNFIKNYMLLSLNAKTREFISEIEQNILLFEYEKAIAKIDKALASAN
jgi:CheY-like chemotaxis protein/HPt (histidine-containing phosphotransfer) domain-containing protein